MRKTKQRTGRESGWGWDGGFISDKEVQKGLWKEGYLKMENTH